MANSIYGIGTSALSAAQAGLLTAGHNISNANTEGYSRQRVGQASNVPLYSGGAWLGQGVHTESIRRQYDDLLAGELRTAQAQAGHSQAYLNQLQSIDSLLADPLSGLSPSIDEFFAGVHDVASRPSDAAARQNLLSAAQALVGRFDELDAQLSSLRSGTNMRIASAVGEINSLSDQISLLNRQILAAASGTPGAQLPNDLLDQRDALVSQLSQQARISVVSSSNGNYNVFLANGQALVLDDKAQPLTVRPDPLDAENVQVGLQTSSGLVPFRSTDLDGGTLGGMLAFRDEILASTQNSLGRIALALGTTVNEQQALGLDLRGIAGTDMFSLGSPQVLTTSSAVLSVDIADTSALTVSDYRLRYDGTNYTLTRLNDGVTTTFAGFPQSIDGLTLDMAAAPAPAVNDSFLIQPTRSGASALGVLFADPARLAAASPVRTTASMSNTGTGTISPGRVDADYPATPLGAALTLSYSTATGTLSGFPVAAPVTVTVNGTATTYAAGAPVPYTSGATFAWNGIEIEISGTPANGDSFGVAPNTNAVGDNRNMLAMAALQTGGLIGGNTLQQSYGQLVSVIGNKTREVQVAAESQYNLVTQVRATRESVSGVNLDEEAADLLRFQQAYQAAGKLIGVAQSMFETILGLGR